MAASTSPRGLGDLPDELLLQIIKLLPSHEVGSMCLVSRRMNSVADPVLHKNIMFNEPEHHMTFTESLITRPRRGSLIQNIRLEYPGSELSHLNLRNSLYQIDRFSHALSTMSNLEDLYVSVPDPLCHGIGTLFNGPFDLACLKTCYLFFQRDNDEYWDLQESIHIFAHPTLEKLTIRRAKLDEKGFDSLEKPEYTALQELHFVECDINDDALSDILQHPEALKEFTMIQKEEPTPELEETPDDIGDYINALKSAQHSLETIIIDYSMLKGKKALRLREFDQLKTLELRDFQLYGSTRKAPRLHSVGLPPNLETLTFHHPFGRDEEVNELLCYSIENKEIMARQWRQMVVVEDENGIPPKIVDACRALGNFLSTMSRGDDD